MTLSGFVLAVVLPIFGIAFVLTAWRVLVGPTHADRIVALDTLSAVLLGAAVCLAVVAGVPALGDAVLVIALLGFLGTLAYGLYLGRPAR